MVNLPLPIKSRKEMKSSTTIFLSKTSPSLSLSQNTGLMSEGLIERVLERQFNSRLFSKSLTQRNLTFSIVIIAQINTHLIQRNSSSSQQDKERLKLLSLILETLSLKCVTSTLKFPHYPRTITSSKIQGCISSQGDQSIKEQPSL